nr:SpoIIE family protein phosphatase [Lachnospiraceae bacterium]
MEEKEILSEFTKSRVTEYADLLNDIAESYLPEEKKEDEVYVTRADLFARKEMDRQRAVFYGVLRSASRQLAGLAKPVWGQSSLAEKQEKRIVKELINAGIEIREFYKTENRNGYTEIGMLLRARERTYYDADDIADLLTEVLHIRMLPPTEGHLYVKDEWTTFCFQEEPSFQIYGGYAKVTKEGEELSGDNYLMREFGDGTYIAAIADGMGSGEKACEDSEKVLLMVERHVESGLAVKSCIHMCDEMLYLQYRGERSVSLDLLELNLYTGECRICKNGAAPSFLIRDRKVREFAADRLSLGINPRVDGYRESVFLQSQDVMILASDGIMDLFYDNMEMFRSYVSGYVGHTLSDLAANILQTAIRAGGGVIRDDMTVLAVGVCEKGVLPVAF